MPPTHRVLCIGRYDGNDVALIESEALGRLLAVIPDVPDDASPSVKEGLIRQRLALLEGVCPCGAAFVLTVAGGICAHEYACPAGEDKLRANLARSA